MEVDFSGWDKAFPYDLFAGSIAYVNMWYVRNYNSTLLMCKKRVCVFCGIVYGVVIICGYAVIMAIGVVSGGAATTTINNVGHEIGANVVLHDHCVEQQLPYSLGDFSDLFRTKVFGDDGLYASRVASFTQPCYARLFHRRFGMDATPAGDKSSQFTDFRDLDTTSFLRRSFRLVDGEMRGCLHKSVIYEMCRWFRTTASPYEEVAIRQNVDAAQREAFLWGKSFFTEFQREINHALFKRGFQPVIHTYELLTVQFHSDEGLGIPYF
jgi:hypothetical protein